MYDEDSDEEYDRVNNLDGDDDEDGNFDGVELEYDEDGRLAPKNKNKSKIEPLPTVDHSKISYPTLKKCFYDIHSEVKALSESDIKKIRASLEISTMNNGNDIIPAPVQLFHHINFPSLLLREIKNLRYRLLHSICIDYFIHSHSIINICVLYSALLDMKHLLLFKVKQYLLY